MRSTIKKKLDYSDYAAIPPDRNRYEILRGRLLVTPSPSTAHQSVSGELYTRLRAYFHGRKLGKVFYAPLDVILTKWDVLQPDLMVVADPELISERGIEGPPLLVVEILSKSTRKRDRGVKAERYAEVGVAHYWLVDPQYRRIECQRLETGSYEIVAEARDSETLTHPDWPDLALELKPLWP